MILVIRVKARNIKDAIKDILAASFVFPAVIAPANKTKTEVPGKINIIEKMVYLKKLIEVNP